MACAQLQKVSDSYVSCLAGMVGGSAVMQRVFELVKLVAPSTAPVVLCGASGTGKELVARAIHALSPQSAGPFVPINCSALPEGLVESELFGHVRGSFTGATEQRAGCFELANKGTLLLDEIAEMPLAAQAKLLRVVEDHKIRRLGSTAEIHVDVRLIASTNVNLENAVSDGRFREDLYYRLKVFEIELPELRQRAGDIPSLIGALIPGLNRRHSCTVSGVDDAALMELCNQDWPGNVRELKNVLERAIIWAGDGMIGVSHLGLQLPAAVLRSSRISPAKVAQREFLRATAGMTVASLEEALIELTLRNSRTRTAAATMLGISGKTLTAKLAEYSARKLAF